MCLISVIHVLVVSRQKQAKNIFSNENVSCSLVLSFYSQWMLEEWTRTGWLFIAHSASDRKGALPVRDPGSQVNDLTQHVEFTPICMASWCKILVFISNMKCLCYKQCKEMQLSSVKCNMSFMSLKSSCLMTIFQSKGQNSSGHCS